MRHLLHTLQVILITTCSIYGQTSVDSNLQAIDTYIDRGGAVDGIYPLIQAYYQTCESQGLQCNNLDYVRFIEASYSWHHLSPEQMEHYVQVFARDHGDSPFLTAMEGLLKHKQREVDAVSIVESLDTLPQQTLGIICERFSNIAIVSQRCFHLQQPFEVTIADTLSTGDTYIYQLAYSGNRGLAPLVHLLRSTGADELEVVINTSAKGSIAVPKTAYQQVVFSVPGGAIRPDTIDFNLTEDADGLPTQPWVAIGEGIYLKGLSALQPPIEVTARPMNGPKLTYIYSSVDALSHENLLELLPAGEYLIQLASTGVKDNIELSVKIPAKKGGLPWVLFFLGGTLLLAFIYSYRRLRRRPTAIPVVPGKRSQKPAIPNVIVDPPTKDVVESAPVPSTPPDSAEQVSLAPKVNKVNASVSSTALTDAEVSDRRQSEDYIMLDLDRLWSDSFVQRVFLKEMVIRNLDVDVRNPDNMKQEIGGFLMGRYWQHDGRYDIFIDNYLDIEGEGQSEFQIGFGATAWAKLEEALEQMPQLELIGWFHTHPGHGVFLSRPDKNISSNFFSKPYQVAMEIDPLDRPENPDLDTAFFTQKTDGSLNNSADLASSWFSWKEIYDHAKDP